MAVGYSATTDAVPLIEQWDGHRWNVDGAPQPDGTAYASLSGVACTSTTFCMAVGTTGFASNEGFELAEEWNGTAWSILDTPAPPDNVIYNIQGVSCATSTSCTAVGGTSHMTGTDPGLALVETWNGSGWTVAATPAASTRDQLFGISCQADGFCIAVGDSAGTAPLAMSSTGDGWTITPTVDPGTDDELHDVSCVSVAHCVGVGTTDNNDNFRPLVETYDSGSWTQTTVPAFGGNLNGVDCVSATACVADGYAGLIDTWDGAQWTVNPTPQTDDTNGRNLDAVSCFSATECTTAGKFVGDDSLLHTFVESTCDTKGDLDDGDWAVSGCFISPDATDNDSTQASNLDGLVVTPDSTTTDDYDTGGGANDQVTSPGESTIALNLTSLTGTTDEVPIIHAPLNLALGGAPVTVSLPVGFTLAGISMTGTLTMTPGPGGAVTGAGTGTLPAVLGGGTAKVSFTSTLAGGVTALTASGDTGSLAKLFALEHITLTYDKGSWSVAATAMTPEGQHRALEGSLTYNTAGALTGGGLTVSNLSLGGLVTINKLTVSYASTTGWTGSASLAQGTHAATIKLTFNAAGQLTSGSLHASKVTLFQVFDLTKFDVDYAAAANEWRLSVGVAGDKGSTAAADFAERDGAVEGVDLDIEHIALLRKITLNKLSLHYDLTNGHTTYTGSADVNLPGEVLTGIEGELRFTDGDFTHAKLVLHGNVPLFEVVFLNSLGVEVSLKPHEEIKGSVGLSAGPKVDGTALLQLDGELGYQFPDTSAGNGTYTFTGAISVLRKTLGEGKIIVGGDSAALTVSLGASGKGFALGPDARLTGDVTGHVVRRSFTARGHIALTLDVHGHHYEAASEATFSNRGVVVCGHFPSLGNGDSGVAEEWGHAPVIKRGDCAPANF